MRTKKSVEVDRTPQALLCASDRGKQEFGRSRASGHPLKRLSGTPSSCNDVSRFAYNTRALPRPLSRQTRAAQEESKQTRKSRSSQ